MHIEIKVATVDQKPILANLFELYAYDLTEFADFDLRNDGFYGYEKLPMYWTEANRFPFLIYVDEKIAGFVLVQKGSPISEDSEIYDIAEFFIMRKYRRKDVGTTVAVQIWDAFKGPWQVRVWGNNLKASSFWAVAIEKFTKKKSNPTERLIENQSWLIHTFNSK